MADRPSSQKKDIPNKKGKTNWVEKAGGLPKYIERVAKHIYESTGDVSRAIAGAVSQTKKRAAKGNKEAIAAIAQWEAMKASTKHASIKTDEDMVMHLAVQISVASDEDFDMDAYELALSAARTERGLEQHYEDGGPIDVIAPEDFDYGRYVLALNQERQVRGLTLAGVQERPLHMAITFDPAAHPRDLKGRFKETIGSLEVGGSVDLPDGTRVTNTGSNFKVVSPDHGKATQIKSADTAAEKALAYSGASTNPKSVGGARSYPSSDRAVKAHEKKAGETTGGGEGEATGIDKDIADLEKAYAAAQKSGNAKVRNDTFQRLQRLKKARDANAPAAEDETFKVVPSKGGSGAPPGQWTQHSSGDLEIEMPDNGPTARITEAEHGGPGTWSANVFPSGDANDSESRDDFQSADEAREWAQERIESGDITPGGGDDLPDDEDELWDIATTDEDEGRAINAAKKLVSDHGEQMENIEGERELIRKENERADIAAEQFTEAGSEGAPDAALQEFVAGLPEGWEWNGTGDPDYGELLGPNDERVTVEADDDGWYAVNEESGAEGTGATPAEAFAAVSGEGAPGKYDGMTAQEAMAAGATQEEVEAIAADAGTTGVGDLEIPIIPDDQLTDFVLEDQGDPDGQTASVLSAVDAAQLDDDDEDPDLQEQLRNLQDGVKRGKLTEPEMDLLDSVFADEIEASEENLRDDGESEAERQHLNHIRAARRKLQETRAGRGQANAETEGDPNSPEAVRQAVEQDLPDGWDYNGGEGSTYEILDPDGYAYGLYFEDGEWTFQQLDTDGEEVTGWDGATPADAIRAFKNNPPPQTSREMFAGEGEGYGLE